MKSSVAVVIGACLAVLASLDARAADPVPATAPAARTPIAEPLADESRTPRAGEPHVKHTVIDDGRARIEELRVRGQLQRITVDPKGPAPGYEVLTGNGARVIADDPGTSRGSAGKRVWNVLRF